MDQKILSELGDYLLAHREEIIAEWLRAVERNADISSSDHLNYKELVDHLPKLCQELTEVLKNPQSNQSRAEVSRAARVHGKYRWRQGYRLEEVIRESEHCAADSFPQLGGSVRSRGAAVRRGNSKSCGKYHSPGRGRCH